MNRMDRIDLERQNEALRQALALDVHRLYQLGDMAEKSGEPIISEFARKWAAEARRAATAGSEER